MAKMSGDLDWPDIQGSIIAWPCSSSPMHVSAPPLRSWHGVRVPREVKDEIAEQSRELEGEQAAIPCRDMSQQC